MFDVFLFFVLQSLSEESCRDEIREIQFDSWCPSRHACDTENLSECREPASTFRAFGNRADGGSNESKSSDGKVSFSFWIQRSGVRWWWWWWDPRSENDWQCEPWRFNRTRWRCYRDTKLTSPSRTSRSRKAASASDRIAALCCFVVQRKCSSVLGWYAGTKIHIVESNLMIHCDAGAVQPDSKETLTKTPSKKFKQAQRGQCERYQRYFSHNRNFWSPESQTFLRNPFVYIFLNLFWTFFIQGSFLRRFGTFWGLWPMLKGKPKVGSQHGKHQSKVEYFRAQKGRLTLLSTPQGWELAWLCQFSVRSRHGHTSRLGALANRVKVGSFLNFLFTHFYLNLPRSTSLNLFAKTSLAKFAPQLLWSPQLIFWDGMVGSVCPVFFLQKIFDPRGNSRRVWSGNGPCLQSRRCQTSQDLLVYVPSAVLQGG